MATHDSGSDLETQGRHRLLLIALALLLAALGGYYLFLSGPPGPTFRSVYPAQGIVTYRGTPADRAQIYLVPVEKSEDITAPRATVRPDGTFRLSTYGEEDGAPVGRYNVAITWLDETVRQAVLPDRMQGKYSDAPTSGLTSEIKAQPLNDLGHFDLK